MIGVDYQSFDGCNHFHENNSVPVPGIRGLAAWFRLCVPHQHSARQFFSIKALSTTVKEGMTRSQVRYLLGTPMVADSFDKERWDYIYYLKKGRSRHVRFPARDGLLRRRQGRALGTSPRTRKPRSKTHSAAKIKNGRVY